MPVTHYLLALIICTGVGFLEKVCAGPDPLTQLRELRQPPWAPPVSVWLLIGIFWYAICFAALARLLPTYEQNASAVWLLIVLMGANAGANVPQFRMRRLDIAFLYLLPYWGFLAAFIWTVRTDPVLVSLFGIYCAYQLYAAAWGWKLWRLNRGAG